MSGTFGSALHPLRLSYLVPPLVLWQAYSGISHFFQQLYTKRFVKSTLATPGQSVSRTSLLPARQGSDVLLGPPASVAILSQTQLA